MMKLFVLLILFSNFQAFSQDADYPERDPALETEFSPPHSLPESDYEDVPREEQEYIPEAVTDDVPPEEVYEADEEYLE